MKSFHTPGLTHQLMLTQPTAHRRTKQSNRHTAQPHANAFIFSGTPRRHTPLLLARKGKPTRCTPQVHHNR